MTQHRILSLKNAPASNWAGGSTHQLYIYPQGAQYQQRDFGYRISVAVCHLESSAYTSLPGVERHLLMLSGSATICHKGREALVLHPYQGIDVFDGGIATVAEGKVTDFNLMTANGWKGKLALIANPLKLEPDPALHSLALYCHEGQAVVAWEGRSLELLSGDLLVIDAPLPLLQINPCVGQLLCCKLWQP